jgi:hypothetical protein
MRAKFIEGAIPCDLGLSFTPETDDERLLLRVFERQATTASHSLLRVTGWRQDQGIGSAGIRVHIEPSATESPSPRKSDVTAHVAELEAAVNWFRHAVKESVDHLDASHIRARLVDVLNNTRNVGTDPKAGF